MNVKDYLMINIIENFEEISYKYVIISLIHKNNNDRIKIKGETNGSHFNFSDELFHLLQKFNYFFI